MNHYIIPIQQNDPRLFTTMSQAYSLVDLGKRLLDAAKNGDVEEVKSLMNSGAPFTTDWLGISPLHFSCMNGHLSTCEALLRAGISRDARTKVDRTPLHLAAQEGHADIVELLLKNGADIEAKDMLRMTALHWAAERGHAHVINVLMRYGGSPRVHNKFEMSPIEVASQKGHREALDAMQNPPPSSSGGEGGVLSGNGPVGSGGEHPTDGGYIITEEETLVPAAPPADEVVVTAEELTTTSSSVVESGGHHHPTVPSAQAHSQHQEEETHSHAAASSGAGPMFEGQQIVTTEDGKTLVFVSNSDGTVSVVSADGEPVDEAQCETVLSLLAEVNERGEEANSHHDEQAASGGDGEDSLPEQLGRAMDNKTTGLQIAGLSDLNMSEIIEWLTSQGVDADDLGDGCSLVISFPYNDAYHQMHAFLANGVMTCEPVKSDVCVKQEVEDVE